MITLESVANIGNALAAATLYPWIVSVRFSVGHEVREEHKVLLATLNDSPDPHDMLPDGAQMLRFDVFPATRFDTMALPSLRARHASHYRAYRVWRKARALGMTPAQLMQDDGYAPYFAATVDRWIREGD
jgi:hypothetical protein